MASKSLSLCPGIQHGESGRPGPKAHRLASEAWYAGADYIVVGRSILESNDPAEAGRTILALRP